MRRQSFRRQKFTRAFQHYLDAIFVPCDLFRSQGVGETDAMAVDGEAVSFARDRHRPASVHAVELEQMSGGFRAALGFVDMDHAEVGIAERGAQRQAAHAPETIDSYAYRHRLLHNLSIGSRLGAGSSGKFQLADFPDPALDCEPLQRVERKTGKDFDAMLEFPINAQEESRAWRRCCRQRSPDRPRPNARISVVRARSGRLRRPPGRIR